MCSFSGALPVLSLSVSLALIMDQSSERKVLIVINEHRRPVSFSCHHDLDESRKALTAAICAKFNDVVPLKSEFIFQVKSEEWGGEFVDWCEADIADKSVVKTVLVPTSVEVHISVYLCTINFDDKSV